MIYSINLFVIQYLRSDESNADYWYERLLQLYERIIGAEMNLILYEQLSTLTLLRGKDMKLISPPICGFAR